MKTRPTTPTTQFEGPRTAGPCSPEGCQSCTAGAIASILSQAEGASDILHGEFITYTKAHTAKALGVSEHILKEQGSVNAEVVRQLAASRLLRKSN